MIQPIDDLFGLIDNMQRNKLIFINGDGIVLIYPRSVSTLSTYRVIT